MKKIECSGDWLVEYADGDLSLELVRSAKEHLTACPHCSQALARLQQSRELLTTYFGSLTPATTRGVRPSPARRRVDAAAKLAVAAIVALVLLGIGLFAFRGGPKRDVAKTPAAGIQTVPQTIPVPSTGAPTSTAPADDDVLAQITRETQIARLRAASEILAKEPGMMERHLAIDKYLAEAYGVTADGPKSEMYTTRPHRAGLGGEMILH